MDPPVTRTLFILDELYPVDRGGIGRLMFNIVQHAKQQDPALDLHILLGRARPADTSVLDTALNGAAQVHYLDSPTEVSHWLGVADITRSIATNPQLSPPFQQGLQVLHAALSVQEKVGRFDHIEIPDHMGLGAVLLMARAAGQVFQNTEITCRLHSSLSAILAFEPFFHPRNDWLAPRVEFERYSLQQADRVVAHIPEIAEFTRQHFGFEAAWMHKVEIAFPPAIWPDVPPETVALPAEPDFVFTSRFQPFKRPELFIKAACAFLDQSPDYSGVFRLISYGYSAEYIDSLRLLVPDRFLNKIILGVNFSDEARHAAMARAVIVQPSSFESLCALAYEVASAKNPILLAQDCAAFGGFPRWIDGENCLLFAPTPAALADSMRKAVRWRPSAAVDITPDSSYFTQQVQETLFLESDTPVTVFVGPLGSDSSFGAFADFAAQTGISAVGFASARYQREGVSGVAWLDEGGFQGAQLVALAAGHPRVVFASPEALPTKEFIKTGRKLTKSGVAFSANATTPDAERLYIYSGKMQTLLQSDHRPCPPCIMLHQDDLGLIAPEDDQDIILRILARLAQSDVGLQMSPLPLVIETLPLAAQKPDRRLLGYDRVGNWQHGVQKIAVDVKSARHTPLLHAETPEVTTTADLSALAIPANTPTAIPLDFGKPFYGEIIGIKIVNTSDSEAAVSLHRGQPEVAISAHEAGKQQRKFGSKQGYIARWSANWGEGKRMLVASSEADIVLKIERFMLFSRE